MKNDITTAEAMVFAVAVHEAVNEAKPVMPSMVIMAAVTRVDFSSDTLPEDVRRIVEQLTEREITDES